MVITLINMLGLLLFIIIMTAGFIVKNITDKKVEDLDGFNGSIKKKQEFKKGHIISTL